MGSKALPSLVPSLEFWLSRCLSPRSVCLSFSAELEVVSAAFLKLGVGQVHALDTALGQPPKRTLSVRDVPGLPRGAIAPAAAAGVDAFSVGMNGRIVPPLLPPAFLWRDAERNTSAMVWWHAFGYGACVLLDSMLQLRPLAAGIGIAAACLQLLDLLDTCRCYRTRSGGLQQLRLRRVRPPPAIGGGRRAGWRYERPAR
eukprot:SAG22_NODE_519_length_9510_cov_6.192222_9_plen_200_part_00